MTGAFMGRQRFLNIMGIYRHECIAQKATAQSSKWKARRHSSSSSIIRYVQPAYTTAWNYVCCCITTRRGVLLLYTEQRGINMRNIYTQRALRRRPRRLRMGKTEKKEEEEERVS